MSILLVLGITYVLIYSTITGFWEATWYYILESYQGPCIAVADDDVNSVCRRYSVSF